MRVSQPRAVDVSGQVILARGAVVMVGNSAASLPPATSSLPLVGTTVSKHCPMSVVEQKRPRWRSPALENLPLQSTGSPPADGRRQRSGRFAQTPARPANSDSLGLEPRPQRTGKLPGGSNVQLLPWVLVPEEKLGVVVGRELYPHPPRPPTRESDKGSK